MFVGTLRAPYYERLIGSATKNFADMVISSEMFENAIENNKISIGETSRFVKKTISKGKEKEVNVIDKNYAKFNQSLHLA